MKTALALAFMMSLPLLAGCTTPGPAPRPSLAREVTLNLTPALLDVAGGDDADPIGPILAAANATFVFTNHGDAVNVADLSAQFTDKTGGNVTRPLASFTSLKQVGRGESVRVAGVLPTSDFAVLKGGRRIAARIGAQHEWLQSDGAPLPLAAEAGGLAKYAFSSKASIALGFDRASFQQERAIPPQCHVEPPANPDDAPRYVCEPATTRQVTVEVSSLAYNGTASATGNVTLRAEAVPDALALSLEGDVAAKISSVMEADISMDAAKDGTTQKSETDHVGIDAGFEAKVSGRTRGEFGAAGLQRTGSSSNIWTDGHIWMFNKTVPRSAHHEMVPMEHPLAQEVSPYEEHPYVAKPEDAAPPKVAQQLRALYGLTLQTGDRFTFTGQAGPTLSFRYDLQTAGRQDKQVAGTSFDALRMQGSFELTALVGGAPKQVEATEFTYFVDAKTLLPLEYEGDAAKTFKAADFAPIFDQARDLMELAKVTMALPETLSLVFATHSRLALTQYAPGLQAGLPVAVPTAILFPLAIMGFSRLGESSSSAPDSPDSGSAPDPSTRRPAPAAISFTKDEAADRLTVVHMGGAPDWSTIGITADACNDASTIYVGGAAPPHQNTAARLTSKTAISGAGCAEGFEPLTVAAAPTLAVVGDFLSLCASVPSDGTSVSLIDYRSGTLLALFTFDSVGPCI